MEKRYWVFAFIISIIAGLIAGLGNLEASILAGTVTFVMACMATKVLLDIFAGKTFTEDLLTTVIVAVSIYAGIFSAMLREAVFSLFMALICLLLCLLAEMFFLIIFGNERIPVAGAKPSTNISAKG